MKKLLYVLLFVPLLVLGQTTSENYVVSKVYKKATTTPIIGNSKDEVSTTVQYFDGLGRAKQSVIVQGGGVLSNANEVPIDWTLNNTGSTGFFNQNGTTSENKIINGTTPFGATDLLWECNPDATSNADGGWNTDNLEIDNTKTYRYTVWVKKNKVGGGAQGRTYHGIVNVNNLNGTVNNNPYFSYPLLSQANNWYLMVGVVHPHNYTGSDTGKSGLYDTNGNKVLDGTEFKWRSDQTTTRLRSYLYYCTDTSVRQYFWSPLFQQVDGGELTINELTSSESAITSQTAPKDIVTHYEYDEFGRQTKEYLPYATTTNNGAINTGDIATATKSYYQVKHTADFAGVSLPNVNAYSEKVLENSPLGRVFEQAAPGKDWEKGSTYSSKGYTNNSHSIKFEYDVNVANEVKSFTVTTSFANNTYTPSLTGGTFYNAGTLSKTITKDENWVSGLDHTTEEFKNKQGQVILKRTYNVGEKHDTYYVYDDFGNLTYVLPPKMDASTVTLSTINTKLNDLGYQYKYDHRNRLVEKKIPGKGWEYIVYDKLDRPVLTQDANLEVNDDWLFTKYDALGRVVYSGKFHNGRTRLTMYPLLEGMNSTQVNENRRTSDIIINGVKIYYNHSSYPQENSSNVNIYTVNYYDTYVDLETTGLNTTVTTSYGVTSTSNTKGLATVSKVRVLDTNNWITTVTYYDEKARPIYVYSKNDELQTIDIVESKLDDFTGKVLETKTTHKKEGKADIVTIDRFEYDHMDRLLSQTQKVNNQISNRVVKNNYDELGQLESKLTGNGTRSGYKDVTSGVTINNDVITKTGTIGWNHGLATLGSFQGDGYVEFEASQTNKHLMVGLSNANSNANYHTIKYAIYPATNKELHIYELGIHKGMFGTYEIDDVFRVERIGSEVHYKKNDETFYISQTPSTGALLGDVSMYNDGGKIKDFKIVDNSKGLQKVDYDYNVRGWLKNINQDNLNDNDLFNFSINYNSVEGNAGASDKAVPLYNGNIAQTIWSSKNTDQTKRAYAYKYDALNRLNVAYSRKDNDLNTAEKYSMWLGYDKNGNIKNLYRNGIQGASTYGRIDELTYSYSGNQLLKVVENGSSGVKSEGFKDGTNTGNDYTYDANGNMVKDLNKGIGTSSVNGITYNHLNLPTEVKFNNSSTKKINYVYDANGTKLKKIVNNNGAITTTEYAGNHIYENNTLQFFNHPEGYVSPVNANDISQGFKYVYQYKDHLGNVRLSYADNNNDGVIQTDGANSEIIEESNYYPFGLKHKGYNGNISSIGNSVAQKFGFGGKELNQELGLEWMDFDARNYDAALGRWMNIDPLAEMMRRHSPYNYAFNNPVYFIDPDGMAPIGEMGEEDNFDKFHLFGNNKMDTTSDWHKMMESKGTDQFGNETNYISGESKSGNSDNEGDCCGGTGNGFTDALAFQEAMSPTSSGNSKNGGTKTFLGGVGRGFGLASMGVALNAKSFAKTSEIILEGVGKWNVYSKSSLDITSRVSSYAKYFGRSAGFMSIGLNMMDYKEGKVSGIGLTSSTGFSLVGMYGGPVGWAGSVTYFAFDLIIPEKQRVMIMNERASRAVKAPTTERAKRIMGSCFVKGTKILMSDRTEKNIEEIIVGDKILSVNIETMKIEADLVVAIPNALKKYRIIEAEFSNGTTNKFSPAHPYWVKGKGWAVFDTEEAKTELKFSVKQLKKGDVVLYYEKGELKETVIESLTDTGKYIEMYNVEFVEKNHTFFANKVLVHNKRIN